MNRIKTTIAFCSLLFITNSAFSQTNDAIRMIFSAKKFSVTEEFKSDSMNYIYRYTFTKKEKKIEVSWDEIVMNNSKEEINSKEKTTISYDELKRSENFYNNCVVKIKKGPPSLSTLSKYTFKDEFSTYLIDDDSSMVCVNDLKQWREKMFQKVKSKH